MDWIDLTIFDFDGTLIQFEHDHFFDRLFHVGKRWGFEHISQESLERSFRRATLIEDLGFSGIDVAKIHRFFDEVNEHGHPPPVLIEGAVEALEHLIREGHHIAIATARSDTRDEVATQLKKIGLLKYMSIISTWNQTNWSDKVEQIHRVCKEVKIPPSKTKMVGDMPSDIVSAHKAGVSYSVAVLSGGVDADVLETSKPHALLKDVSDLPAIYTLVIEEE